MPRYEVLGTNHIFYSVFVEANSAEEANLIASDMSAEEWNQTGDEFEIHLDSTELSN